MNFRSSLSSRSAGMSTGTTDHLGRCQLCKPDEVMLSSLARWHRLMQFLDENVLHECHRRHKVSKKGTWLRRHRCLSSKPSIIYRLIPYHHSECRNSFLYSSAIFDQTNIWLGPEASFRGAGGPPPPKKKEKRKKEKRKKKRKKRKKRKKEKKGKKKEGNYEWRQITTYKVHIKCCFFRFFNSPVALKNNKKCWPQEKVEMTPLVGPAVSLHTPTNNYNSETPLMFTFSCCWICFMRMLLFLSLHLLFWNQTRMTLGFSPVISTNLSFTRASGRAFAL